MTTAPMNLDPKALEQAAKAITATASTQQMAIATEKASRAITAYQAALVPAEDGEFYADYSELTADELDASDPEADALIARSRVVSSKRFVSPADVQALVERLARLLGALAIDMECNDDTDAAKTCDEAASTLLSLSADLARVTRELDEIKGASTDLMLDTGASAWVDIRDYASACERAEEAEREIARLRSLIDEKDRALEADETRFECIRQNIINHLKEPERNAFWTAVSGRDAARAARTKGGDNA